MKKKTIKKVNWQGRFLNDNKVKLLISHCIGVFLDNNKVYAEDVIVNIKSGETTKSWVDVTDYSNTRLKTWLGY